MRSMKRRVAGILPVLITTITISVNTTAAEFGDFTYSEKDGKITIDRYNGKSGDVVIPGKINGKTVVDIGGKAFIYKERLNNITIPSSVTSIAYYAFRGSTGLTNINVAENNTVYASINGVLFSYDKKTLIRYPEGKTAETYKIPDGITEIGESVFSGCKNLTDIIIPDSVIKVSSYAFSECKELNKIKVTENNTHYASIDGVLFSYDKKILIRYPEGKKTDSYQVPNGVSDITDGAFMSSKKLTKINISGSVTKINNGSFDFCDNLIDINVAENNLHYSSINGVLLSADKKTLIKFPGGIKSKTYTIPYGVTSIGEKAFCFSEGLSNVIISDNVSSIGAVAFGFCPNLINIDVVKNNMNYSSIDGVLFTRDKKTIIQYPDGKKIETYTIPDGVTTIDTCTFSKNSVLKNIYLPDSIQKFDFWDFVCLENITFFCKKGSALENFAKENSDLKIKINVR